MPRSLPIKPGDTVPTWAAPYCTGRLAGHGGGRTFHLVTPDGSNSTLCGRISSHDSLGWASEYPWNLCGDCAAEAVRRCVVFDLSEPGVKQ